MKREWLCRHTSACIATGTLAAPLLAGCVAPGVEETILPARMDYVCANKRVLPVARGADGRYAAARIDGKDIVLQRAGSTAQEKYSDGRYRRYVLFPGRASILRSKLRLFPVAIR